VVLELSRRTEDRARRPEEGEAEEDDDDDAYDVDA
jgi:hypothetical protein